VMAPSLGKDRCASPPKNLQMKLPSPATAEAILAADLRPVQLRPTSLPILARLVSWTGPGWAALESEAIPRNGVDRIFTLDPVETMHPAKCFPAHAFGVRLLAVSGKFVPLHKNVQSDRQWRVLEQTTTKGNAKPS
jgi:hypothetical protein